MLQNHSSSIVSMDEEYKQDMARLLSEIFQGRKNKYFNCEDVSLEILWLTREVKNQPYKASISLYIILRALGNNIADVETTLTTIMKTCNSTLDFRKYDYRNIDFNELYPYIKSTSDQSIKAVIKNEDIESLQNNIVPFCFSFDRIAVTKNDLSRIVDVLTEHPNSGVSFQIIPVSYSSIEASAIDGAAQSLAILSRGIQDANAGNISFSLAERHAEAYKYYSLHKNSALFAFNMLVYGTQNAANVIATRLLAQLNNAGELRVISLSPGDVQKNNNFYPLPWAVHELLLDIERNPSVWNSTQNLRAFRNIPYIITAEEASGFFRLPIGSDAVHAGLVINESDKANRTYENNIVGGSDVELGFLKSSSHADSIGISLDDLAKHMLIVGTPGSGKTTFSIGLLDRLWKKHGIPFLVIEPAKNEYRSLVQSIPELQIFTPGKNFISPFVFNPFVPPKNVKLETYKSTLKTAFAAAVSMSTPLDKIFEETLNNCYSDFRWLDTYTRDDKGRVFNISDFIKSFCKTFDAIGYTGDAKNIGRAGLVRLQSLVNLFDNYPSIPIEDLLTKPTVIELAAIENHDQKALYISLLLLSVLAYVNNNYLGEGGLRNAILLEEAHVLLDANTNLGDVEANPSAIAQGLVKRMLAEIRSYGVGIIIADQSPRKVTADVVAMTDIKLAFRLVEATDKRIIADSCNMGETHISRLAKLKAGEAFLFFGKLDGPEEIRIDDYRLDNNISITLSDERIREASTYWRGHEDVLRPYPECGYCRCCSQGCDYNRRILGREIAKRIFAKYFKPNDDALLALKKVFCQMTALIIHELNDESFDLSLFACVELHLMRRIRYGTKIKLTDATIKVTLSKI